MLIYHTDLLSEEVFETITSGELRRDHFCCGKLEFNGNPAEDCVTFVNFDKETFRIPLAFFFDVEPTRIDVVVAVAKTFKIIDHGQTVAFGEIQVATDSIIREAENK